MNEKVANVRKDYIFNEANELKESDVDPDPFKEFQKWFNEALKINPDIANAMFLATSTKDGKPSLRTVLLKGFEESGFVFYTNYSSRKGNELKENPYASLLFFWKELERQIRIEGKTVLTSAEESDNYFHSRPFESQIAALASNQSSIIQDRDTLKAKFLSLKEKYKNETVPLPEHWGGYKLIPDKIEFWQGRQNRLHDRILYTKENSDWKIQRLAP